MKPLDLLHKVYGFTSFRPGQEVIVESILAGHNTLAIMPTGGGKSVCYQIPALMMDGLSLVVSPLISLMKDQVDHLNQLGIPAAYINSTLSAKEMQTRLADAARGVYRLLYVAPERLESDRFRQLLYQVPLSLITIDEAHCISQWGHDFRPSYRSLAQWISTLVQRPIIAAFTATATQEVRNDIAQLLSFQPKHIFVTGVKRENLAFSVFHGENIRDFALQYLREHPTDPGIFYCATRKEVDGLHQFLRSRGFSVSKYHAGLTENERQQAQEDFSFDRVQGMVATNAFGMGIDKSNVRFVIHCQMPRNLESYYQEAGRAGRDGETSECILLFSPSDVQTQKYLIEQSHMAPQLKQNEHQKLTEMVRYAHTQACLQETFALYFGDQPGKSCSNCSNCLDEGERTDVTVEAQKIFSCVKRMRERFGVSLTAKVLKGSASKRVKELGFNKLPTYGLLKGYTEKDIVHRIQVLTAEGFLRVTEDEYPVLALTTKAIDVLQGKQSVLLRVKKKSTTTATPVHQNLFETLRTLRKELSTTEQIPPYMIFPDSTLTDLARICPIDREGMRAIRGVGERKLEKYGEAFLTAIRTYIEKEGITPTASPTPSGSSPSDEKEPNQKEPSHLITWRMWQKEGHTLDEVAATRGLTATTLDNHLLRASQEGHPVDWNRLIPQDQEPMILAAIEQAGGTQLRPIKEQLPEPISYTTIKAVLAKQAEKK
ncbi:ATP-dependent DNA helicase, RecQ-like [Marininema mesophilum]|uniref:DNA helicase RecQ n=1 Tax=Marininema mesophilum TaxID=1048340 RepID=A0A1H2SI10_9BACL|nr:DNA helicase RecQ [Marininema mesophilum]SDW31323.1 ATP-dependent DNA helicase, RecQ-like [Marininema mesophilum]